jgi:hypothetical protein
MTLRGVVMLTGPTWAGGHGAEESRAIGRRLTWSGLLLWADSPGCAV